MILNELAQVAPKKQVAKIFEQYFGKQIDISNVKPWQAQHMLKKVRKSLSERRSSADFHQSENNAGYLKLLMMEQALSLHLGESVAGAAQADLGPTDPAGRGAAIPKHSVGLAGRAAAKSQSGQRLTKDESSALSESLDRIQRHIGRRLTESEIQQAQVVLASQDIIDSIQKMIEDMTSVQFKELPALVDSIKNQVGTAEADTFNQAATAALGGLVQNLQGAKQQLEAAQATLTGQAPVVGGGAPGAELGMPGDEMGMPGDEMGAMPPEGEEDLFSEPTDLAEPKPKAGLGRERR